ncbi:restriction endonuclease [Pontibacter chinhatensis]|uniref:Restriction endonuclease n=1 Tax=Pontibacter chinhatensis TaxID=1436961 RepID=A0A1I2ZMK9_9BACT|nr:restriction endonuclease [Pontibacter chinhatensis]SFH38895.1 Restriction endonuclease [Pontibacter chinhatensis]
MASQVYAFAKIDDRDARLAVYDEIKNGKSRFGMWDQEASLRDRWYGKNAFLLRIKKGDWIVHVNMPQYGKCVAVQAIGEYDFDAGIKCHWGSDFNNFIPIDPASILEFDRTNPNVLGSVNLAPRRRAQRVLEVNDFLKSIENLREGKFDETRKEDRSIVHLREKMDGLLPQITSHIHEMNKSKEFENFLHKIFENMPNTISVQNGFGWRSDNGADLLVEFENPIIGINVSTKLVVQAKSYSGQHFDTHAIDRIVTGINHYKADAGLLITTATETERLEKYIREKSEETGKTIDLIAGADVAKFVLRYAPELLIGN